MDSAYAHCMLCPRSCGIDRSKQLGFCGQHADMSIAKIMLHAWEEPPLSVGQGAGAVFFKGCSLSCSYCQNHEISRAVSTREEASDSYEDGNDLSNDAVAASSLLTPEMLAKAFVGLMGEGACNIDLVTPTHFGPSVLEAIGIAKGNGLDLPIVWNTSSYETVERIERSRGLVDIWLADAKYSDSELARGLSCAADYPARSMDAISKMLELAGRPEFDEFAGDVRMTSGVLVRHLVLPGHSDDSKELLSMLHERCGDDVLYSIMGQYTPLLDVPGLNRKLMADEYDEVLDFADSIGIKDYFWQDIESASEDFVPKW